VTADVRGLGSGVEGESGPTSAAGEPVDDRWWAWHWARLRSACRGRG